MYSLQLYRTGLIEQNSFSVNEFIENSSIWRTGY